jgi:hypothetical protein
LKIKYIQIENLKFNKKHFRLIDNTSKLDIINYYLDNFSILHLILSIAENGFFDIEPLIVNKLNEHKYKVIDGNLRLASLKILVNPLNVNNYKTKITKILDETTNRPNLIPCIIIDNNIDISKMLGFKHITGVTSWNMSIKKSYFQYLNSNLYNMNARNIAKTVGSTTKHILQYLITNKLNELLKQDNEYNINSIKISKINSLFQYSNILDFIGIRLSTESLNNINFDNLCIVLELLDNEISTEEYLIKLDNVLENDYNKEQLSQDKLFLTSLQAKSSILDNKINKLNEELGNLTVQNMEKLDTNIIKSLFNRLNHFIKYNENNKLL